ncbi:MAG: hypothetical protein ABI988_18045, partial [Nitrospirota bacterium]
ARCGLAGRPFGHPASCSCVNATRKNTGEFERKLSFSAALLEPIMKHPAAAYSAEVVTSATKAGGYGVLGEGE